MYPHIKKNLSSYLYAFAVMMAGIALVYVWGSSVPAVILSMLFILLLLLAEFLSLSSLSRYILAGIAFIVFFTAVCLYPMGFIYTFLFGFYIPLIYSYLLPDAISPGLVGIAIAYLISDYIGQASLNIIVSMIIVIISSSTSFSLVFYLIRRLQLERDKFFEISITDSLTGLATLSYILEEGQEMINDGHDVTVMVIDLDQFKRINDTYGHAAGNKILSQIAVLLKNEMISLKCTIGRLGGDEFIILLQDYPYSLVKNLTWRLSNSIRNKLFEADSGLEPIKLSCSIGAAHSPTQSPEHIEELLYNADMDMYYNKYGNYKLAAYTQDHNEVLPSQYGKLLHVLAEKDMYTYVHSQYAARYSAALAEALNLPCSTVQELYTAGWLHDLGKIMIPSDILRKPSRLSAGEYDIIKQHVAGSLNILTDFKLSDGIVNAIKYHHERWDGLGYPSGVCGRNTPIEGRILQIADTFSAMTVKRLYREPLPPEKALEEIRRESGAQFDPSLTSVFISIFREKEGRKMAL